MKALWVTALAIIVGIGMNIDVAQAKRMGGGGSFGSKQSQNQPMQRDQATPDKAQTTPQGNNMQPAGANPAAAARPGGMMGGMLGGLLMGGLLGAMFFGGAFENINFADIAIIALLAFVAFKLFKMFAARRTPQAATASAGNAPQHDDMPVMTRDNVNSSAESGAQVAAPASSSTAFAAQSISRRVTTLPSGFDEPGFLAEAKSKYTELQAAWDSGDLGTLRQFTSDKVFGEVQDQYRARNGENRTELQKVNATLINILDDDSSTIASVLFDVNMIEHDANTPVMPQDLNISEVWHFVRSKRAMRPEWILDGIQQVV